VKIDVRSVGDVKILDCSGKITLGEGTISVRNSVRDILKGGSKNIVLNLDDISYVDSAGIGELVSTYTSVVNSGGSLKLLNLSNKTHQLLTITKLLTVFDTFDNEEAAVGSFK
jgi:anti-sigma B factor antagonist